MTKTEFLAKLAAGLQKNKVPDAKEIISEYQAHFAFKLADGFSEEEICAKLGDPALLAAQFEMAGASAKPVWRPGFTAVGLGFTDLFAGVFFALLGAWALILGAFAISCGALSVCLLGDINLNGLIPPMPYWCGAVFGLTFLGLTVLAVVGAIYFAAFFRQLCRSFGRFHHNAMAAASGRPILPALPIAPQFTPKAKRRLRRVALVSLAFFAVSFVLGMIAAMASAEAFAFWHAWGWFGFHGG